MGSFIRLLFESLQLMDVGAAGFVKRCKLPSTIPTSLKALPGAPRGPAAPPRSRRRTGARAAPTRTPSRVSEGFPTGSAAPNDASEVADQSGF